ncbi:hypothetical protein SGFS_018150 [Streptomyces graminofaciens]|uniref:Uncharacterized protein n=1 Tax=Streptomyces graminofaciens TaxID=68212 RepID=A0ABM7F3Z7_9ACTN|nr:hypothetical protein SGFS_018150 [Streptomyces graminofaciens]
MPFRAGCGRGNGGATGVAIEPHSLKDADWDGSGSDAGRPLTASGTGVWRQSAECRVAGDRLTDDEGVHLVGAFVGEHRFQVVRVA